MAFYHIQYFQNVGFFNLLYLLSGWGGFNVEGVVSLFLLPGFPSLFGLKETEGGLAPGESIEKRLWLE